MSNLHDRVKDFSRKFAYSKKSIYVKRNQFNLNKIYEDCYYSKLSEFAAYEFLCGYDAYKPDRPPLLELFRNPNWDADLENETYKFPIKSRRIEVVDRFGLSWTFQESHGRDPILDMSDKNYKVIFVVCYSDTTF